MSEVVRSIGLDQRAGPSYRLRQFPRLFPGDLRPEQNGQVNISLRKVTVGIAS